MAQKNVINKVLTADSTYDTLYPLTPYQTYFASAVTGAGSSYALTVVLPAANIVKPITVVFTPNVTNSASCTISVNGLAAKTLYYNGSALVAGYLNTSAQYEVIYDVNDTNAYIIGDSAEHDDISLINQYTTPTLTSTASAQTLTLNYTVLPLVTNQIVCITVPSTFSSSIATNYLVINGGSPITINGALVAGAHCELVYNGTSFDVQTIISTTDLTAGSSTLATGTMYIVYE